MSKKILVTGSSVRADLLKPLVNAGFAITNPGGLLSESELKAELSDAGGYLLGGDEIATRTALSGAKQLKVIAFLGVGYQSFIDVKAATELKIAITNTPGTLTQTMAEFTVGQVLNATRRLAVYGRYLREHRPESGSDSEEKRHELLALKVGIIGLGAIGSRVAEVLVKGFGCSVVYFSRTRKKDEEKRLGIEYLPLDQLLKTSRVLILLTPGTDVTTGFIGARELDLMPKGSILVNTARRELVQPAALLNALKSGHIETAVYDGFYDSNVPETSELLRFPEERLLVTRHIGSLTHEARDGMAIKAVQSILNVLRSGRDAHIVNG